MAADSCLAFQLPRSSFQRPPIHLNWPQVFDVLLCSFDLWLWFYNLHSCPVLSIQYQKESLRLLKQTFYYCQSSHSASFPLPHPLLPSSGSYCWSPPHKFDNSISSCQVNIYATKWHSLHTIAKLSGSSSPNGTMTIWWTSRTIFVLL